MAPTLYNLEEMDVLLKLHTEQTMAEIFIEGGKIPANDILYYEDLPDTAKFRRIYANTEEFTVVGFPVNPACSGKYFILCSCQWP
jgi:hypothetical protein